MGSTHDKCRVVLAGASGYIGRHVAMTLVRRGYEVVAVLRPGGEAESSQRSLDPALSGCDVCVAPVTNADALADALANLRFDAVISCLASRDGAPDDAWAVDYAANRNLLAAAQHGGASRFVLLSAICVQRPKLAFQHAKLAFERELKASNIDHVIVRPAAFFKSLAGQPVRIRHVSPRVFDIAVGVLAPLSRVLPGLAAKAEFARIGRYYATESMLLWNEQAQTYDADATPSYGEQTLSDFYA